MRKHPFGIFLFVALIHGFAGGQPLGNPVGVRGMRQLTLSLNGSYQTFQPGTQTLVVEKGFIKAGWGLASMLDVYGLLGSARVEAKNNGPGVSNVRDRFRIAYGAGFNFRYPLGKARARTQTGTAARTSKARLQKRPSARRQWWLVGGAWGIRYPFEAQYNLALQNSYIQQFSLDYDAREAAGYVALMMPYRMLKFYAGGAGWLMQRLDTKTQTLMRPNEDPYVLGVSKTRYQSGLWTGAVAGVQVELKQQIALTVEVMAFNLSSYQVMVGVSQTGIRTW
jgi:hypothetical protein